jgi:hypothetical protein
LGGGVRAGERRKASREEQWRGLTEMEIRGYGKRDWKSRECSSLVNGIGV